MSSACHALSIHIGPENPFLWKRFFARECCGKQHMRCCDERGVASSPLPLGLTRLPEAGKDSRFFAQLSNLC
jgi:hypothetical protein